MCMRYPAHQQISLFARDQRSTKIALRFEDCVGRTGRIPERQRKMMDMGHGRNPSKRAIFWRPVNMTESIRLIGPLFGPRVSKRSPDVFRQTFLEDGALSADPFREAP